MKKNRPGGRHGTLRAFCVLTALLVLGLCAGAAATGAEEAAWVLKTPEMILAQDAASRMNLRDQEGNPLRVRSEPEMQGRGWADKDGNEPDYVGVIGFAVLQNNPDMSQFSVFDKAYWTIPQYILQEGTLKQTGLIPHKTPLVVTGQKLEADGKGGYSGLLQVVRLDVSKECLIDVSCFTTLPYWTLPIREISQFGSCIAVYRETPGEGPRDEEGNACILRDGTRILIAYETGETEAASPGENLSVRGVVFRENGDGTIAPQTVYFREADLVLSY